MHGHHVNNYRLIVLTSAHGKIITSHHPARLARTTFAPSPAAAACEPSFCQPWPAARRPQQRLPKKVALPDPTLQTGPKHTADTVLHMCDTDTPGCSSSERVRLNSRRLLGVGKGRVFKFRNHAMTCEQNMCPHVSCFWDRLVHTHPALC